MNRALILAALLAAAPPVPASAQAGGPPVTVSAPAVPRAADPLSRADSLFDAGRPLDALDLLEAFLGRRPSDYGAHWRAARACVSLGVLARTEPEEERWLERGIEHGLAAHEARPDGVEGLYWLVSSRGWLAMVVGNPVRIAELADDVLADLRRLLELSPDHHGAHHAAGKLQYEVMKLNAVERFLARHLLGVDALDEASWASSIEYLERAVALDPENVLYRLDLGITYQRSGHPEQARAALRAALELPPVAPPDRVFQERARALLDRMGEDPPAPGALPGGEAR